MIHPINSTRPRIAIDLHVIDGIFQGSRSHCLELFSRVVGLMPECDFFLLANDVSTLKSFHPNFSLPNIEVLSLAHRSAVGRLIVELPRIVRRLKIGLIHTQYITPPLPFCDTAVTVHDVLFESHPQFFGKFFALRSRALVPFSIRQSGAVFTVSEFSRNQIADIYRVPKGRISVIPNGVNRERFFPGAKDFESVSAVGLSTGTYFLTVGRLEPRKNHTALFQAWSRIPAPRPKLAVVGQRHFKYLDAINLLRSLQLERDVLLLDDVSDAQLPAIYRHARGFIYPSWAEGFGMPILEAMASGIPVITSATTALGEISAGAALHVDPSNCDSIAKHVIALCEDPSLRADLVRIGLQRAQEFTWERSAAIVCDVYRRHFRLPEADRITA
jgi:glycosyltransferase involved in cell wall biosynthesis